MQCDHIMHTNFKWEKSLWQQTDRQPAREPEHKKIMREFEYVKFNVANRFPVHRTELNKTHTKYDGKGEKQRERESNGLKPKAYSLACRMHGTDAENCWRGCVYRPVSFFSLFKVLLGTNSSMHL